MSNLRPYLEDYVKTINHLLANYQDDDAIIDAAEQTWIPTDPRYLVFLECGNYNPRMPQSPPPSTNTGGDVHRQNEIPSPPHRMTQSPQDTAGGDGHRTNDIPFSPPATSK